MKVQADNNCSIFPKRIDTKKNKYQAHIHNQSVHINGFTSIMGLPIPNNGRYEYMPFDVMTMALGYICQITNALADALNIPLLHPMNAFSMPDYAIISPQGNHMYGLFHPSYF